MKDSSASPLNANIATESTSEWNSENGGLLTDGDHSEAAQSADRITLPTDIVLSWPEPVSFDQIQMHCWYAQNQAPTKVSFQVSQDGQIWQEIVPPTVLAWEYADTTLENQTFSFEQVQEVRFLRMKVHDIPAACATLSYNNTPSKTIMKYFMHCLIQLLFSFGCKCITNIGYFVI